MALLAPSIDSKVRRMRSSRHWVRTWMVTPSMRSPSINSRTKSKSVCDAAGKPTSISVKPISTRRSHMRRLRTESIGRPAPGCRREDRPSTRSGRTRAACPARCDREVPRPDRAGTSRRAWCPTCGEAVAAGAVWLSDDAGFMGRSQGVGQVESVRKTRNPPGHWYGGFGERRYGRSPTREEAGCCCSTSRPPR